MKTITLFGILIVAGIMFSGCVKDEIYDGPPAFSNFLRNPQSPVVNQPVDISATVKSLKGVKTVTLFYQVGGQGSFLTTTMTATGNVYSGKLPGQAAGVAVAFYLLAESTTGKQATYPVNAPKATLSLSIIFMNEVFSRGKTTTHPGVDWIEIYNGSDVAVDISGYKIYDNGGQAGSKPKMPFPVGTVIPAKGFYVIETDVGGDSGFGLSSGGEEIWLENDKGNLIDNFIFPATEEMHSYGRKPDGSNTFKIFTQLTRGASNNNATTLP
ncbi:MAG: lamin tail domain-containing protein [Bacteroidales bacterium]|nr:lamin tail domain-containing protein [Bacteroidales bacterium]MDZ4203541.1 lamin tail domain-containing protein [Bacteroidales bacterium]